MPTVKSLAGVMLAALNAPDCERGTENEKSRRLRILMRETGTRMVMIDEFQHFYDRGKRQIMLHVADWLKVLIDESSDQILGAHLLGHNAEEIINLFAMAIHSKIRASDLREMIFAYPTHGSNLRYML